MIELSPALKQFLDDETVRQMRRRSEGYRILTALLKKDYTQPEGHVGDTITLRLPKSPR